MASNAKRRGKKRRAHKRRRPAARRRRKLSAARIRRRRTPVQVNARARRRRRRRRNPKTVRTDVRTVKVMRTNARRKRRARSSRTAARYTLAFTPASAQAFARIARLSKVRRREMRRALRRHPSGGVYVALPAWHGTREQAQRLGARVQLILAYAAGRRRAALTSSAAPRVVAVP